MPQADANDLNAAYEAAKGAQPAWAAKLPSERALERGGPEVRVPTRRGFGSLMIERSLRSYFRGDTAITFDPAGVVFKIKAPLAGAGLEGK